MTDVTHDLVQARSLTLIAGMSGARFNSEPIVAGPEIIDGPDGVEFVQILTSTEFGGPVTGRYLIAADARIDLRTEAS